VKLQGEFYTGVLEGNVADGRFHHRDAENAQRRRRDKKDPHTKKSV